MGLFVVKGMETAKKYLLKEITIVELICSLRIPFNWGNPSGRWFTLHGHDILTFLNNCICFVKSLGRPKR